MPFRIDSSWYERYWLTERAPSQAAAISRRARLAALNLAHHVIALAF